MAVQGVGPKQWMKNLYSAASAQAGTKPKGGTDSDGDQDGSTPAKDAAKNLAKGTKVNTAA